MITPWNGQMISLHKMMKYTFLFNKKLTFATINLHPPRLTSFLQNTHCKAKISSNKYLPTLTLALARRKTRKCDQEIERIYSKLFLVIEYNIIHNLSTSVR